MPLGGTHSLSTRAERDALAVRLREAVDRIEGLGARVAALLSLCERFGVPHEPWMSNEQLHNMSPLEVADARSRGIDVQLHTHRHRGVMNETLEIELMENRAALRRALGDRGHLDHFCYPSGVSLPSAEPILAASGVKSATLVRQGINAPDAHPYRLRRFLDGRSVSQPMFEAYLSGALEIVADARGRHEN